MLLQDRNQLTSAAGRSLIRVPMLVTLKDTEVVSGGWAVKSVNTECRGLARSFGETKNTFFMSFCSCPS